MTRYFFDVTDGQQIKADEVGLECTDDQEAYEAGLAAASAIAQQWITQLKVHSGTLTMAVRKEDGREVAHIELSLSVDGGLAGTET